jgi:hypothetical protein
MIRPFDAWTLARLLCGFDHEQNEERNGEHDHDHEHECERGTLPAHEGQGHGRFEPLVLHLAGLPAPLRKVAWDGYLCGKSSSRMIKNANEMCPHGGICPRPRNRS